MSLIPLTDVHSSNLTFNEIFNIYDTQFQDIKDYIFELSGTFVPGSDSSDAATVSVTSVDVSGQTLRVNPGTIVNLEQAASEILGRVKEIQGIYNSLLELGNTYEEYDERLQQKIDDYNSKRYILENLLADFYAEFTEATTAFNNVDALDAKIEAYRTEILNIRDNIVGISGLSPVELEDREVYLARGGASILGDRLDAFSYKFDTIADMRGCYFLKNNDSCIVLDGIKFFRVTSGAVPSGRESYNIGSGTSLKAYLLGEAIPYTGGESKAFFDTATVSPSVVEIGSTVSSITFSWKTNVVPKSVSLRVANSTHTFSVRDTIGSVTLTVNLTSNPILIASCTSMDDSVNSESLSILFIPSLYYGTGNLMDLSSVDIFGMTSILDTEKEFKVDVATGKYLYILLPVITGKTHRVFIDGISGGYEVLGNRNITNASGKTLNYTVYRTTNSGLGTLRSYIGVV